MADGENTPIKVVQPTAPQPMIDSLLTQPELDQLRPGDDPVLAVRPRGDQAIDRVERLPPIWRLSAASASKRPEQARRASGERASVTGL